MYNVENIDLFPKRFLVVSALQKFINMKNSPRNICVIFLGEHG